MQPQACKICKGHAPFFDRVDFSKNCCEEMGIFLPRTGREISYFQCPKCGFVFTPDFDEFTAEDFCREIYNEDYRIVDPLYEEIRPASNAKLLEAVLREALAGHSGRPFLLDYGSGSGKMTELLGNLALSINYDPFSLSHSRQPEQQFDIIFSSEVLEHVTDPLATLSTMKELLRTGGFLLFSTMTQPEGIQIEKCSWWYISPRNGHISIYSQQALAAACRQCQLHYMPLSTEWHLAWHDGYPSKELDIAKLEQIISRLPKGFIPL